MEMRRYIELWAIDPSPYDCTSISAMRGGRLDRCYSRSIVKNVSKAFFIPNPDLGGEVIESLHDIVGVGLRNFLDNTIEEGVIEPHCL